MTNPTFEHLLNQAAAQDMHGWDFAFLHGRIHEELPPWNYRAEVLDRIPTAHAMLDMGTGGGELLSTLQPLPPNTFATEGYAPNIPVAAARLAPLGVPVVGIGADERLPFADSSFDLVINRHESYDPAEVRRVLRPGGWFLTQQVGGQDMADLNRLLDSSHKHQYSYWDLAFATKQMRAAGLKIATKQEAFPATIIDDIGAVVFMLKVTPWHVPDFTVERYRAQLRALHDQIAAHGPLALHNHRLFIAARRG